MHQGLIIAGLLITLIGVIVYKQHSKFSLKDPFKLFAIFIGISIIFLGACMILLGLDPRL
ncbi:hypothetical protein [Lentilactobacillus farraginis]|uniref:hypothetical protein n=1 Tax=Lentilactobacillus farraginis TaxID=390841 RepID=UPI00068A0FD5|nr:hypothetical protein [Lentilactobacillus farraginis]